MDGSHWAFNGTDFRTLGLITKTVDAIGQLPPVRGSNVPVASKRGQFYVNKVLDQRVVDLGFVIPDRQPQVAGWPGIAKILDQLATLFSPRAQGPLVLYSPVDGNPRTAQAEVTTWSPADHDTSGLVFLGTAEFTLADPCFYGAQVQQTEAISASPTDFTFTNPGTVSGSQLQLAFAGPIANPTLTNNTNGISVTCNVSVASGDTLTIDCAAWTASLASGSNAIGSIVHSGAFAFMEFAPGPNSISVTASTPGGTLTVTFQPPYL